MPKLWAGASGYAYDEWKGSFYPEKIAPDAMLAWYAERLPAVEINNTFYRMPKAAVLAQWAQVTPASFRFAIKASRRITHDARLKADDAAEAVGYLYKNLASLGDKRGPVLFQLPPFLKKDLPRLTEFLAVLPADHRATFEFRHESWFDDEIYTALQAAGAALCLSEREDGAAPPLVETASFGYLRLRLETYAPDELATWAERIASTRWREAHVCMSLPLDMQPPYCDCGPQRQAARHRAKRGCPRDDSRWGPRRAPAAVLSHDCGPLGSPGPVWVAAIIRR